MQLDNFDGDLYNLIPEARDLLEPIAHITFLTHGSADRDGNLSHPSVWNHALGMIAFFGISSPQKPDYFHTLDPVIKCPADYALRSAFVQNYAIMFRQILLYNGSFINNDYFDLLFHARGIKALDPNRKLEIENQFLRDFETAKMLLLAELDPQEFHA